MLYLKGILFLPPHVQSCTSSYKGRSPYSEDETCYLRKITDLELRCVAKSHDTVAKWAKTLDSIKNGKRKVMLF